MKESYEWILRNIESCINNFQLDCCYTLVVLFKMRWEQDVLSDGFTDCYDHLSKAIKDKQVFLFLDA